MLSLDLVPFCSRVVYREQYSVAVQRPPVHDGSNLGLDEVKFNVASYDDLLMVP